MDDFYNGGAFLRRWYIDNTGQAVCPFDAVEVAATAQTDIDAILAANAIVRERIAAVEAYEAAQRIRTGEQPPRDETYVEEGGEEKTRWSDAYREWFDAGKVIEDATAETIELAEVRATGGVIFGHIFDGDGEFVGEEVVSTPSPLVDDYVFTVPAADVPASISPLQARNGLRAWGIGRSQVEAFFASIDDDTQRESAQDAWEYAMQIERDNPLIAGCAAFLGKSKSDIDQFFRDAAQGDAGE